MSRTFIALALKGGPEGGPENIKLSWSLYSAASGLWSSVNIVQEKVNGRSGHATNDWFKERDLELVTALRHGGVHHSDAGTRGIGFRFTPSGVEFFLNATGANGEIPIADVIAFLMTAQSAVDKFLSEASGGLRAVNFSP